MDVEAEMGNLSNEEVDIDAFRVGLVTLIISIGTGWTAEGFVAMVGGSAFSIVGGSGAGRAVLIRSI
jgi:hypothetical protein